MMQLMVGNGIGPKGKCDNDDDDGLYCIDGIEDAECDIFDEGEGDTTDDEAEAAEADADDDEDDDEDEQDPKKKKDKRCRPKGAKQKATGKGQRPEKVTSKAKAKTKAKAEPKMKAPAKGRRSKVVNGKKWCKACKQWLDVSSFINGSAQCAEDRKAIQNIRNAAIEQNELEWFTEVMADEDVMVRVVAKYKERRLTAKPTTIAKTFILDYREEVRQETQLLLDGKWEMMEIPRYCAWMAKSKNGSMGEIQATSLWKEKFMKPGALVDKKSENADFKERVAIKKGDYVTYRDLHSKGSGYITGAGPKKNATMEDVNKADAMMNSGLTMVGAGSDRNDLDLAKSLVAAKSIAGRTTDAPVSAFGEDGRVAQALPKVRDLESSDEEKETKDGPKVTEDANAVVGSGTGKKRGAENGVGDNPPSKIPKLWFGREEAINGLVKSHKTWTESITTEGRMVVEGSSKLLSSINSTLYESVKGEATVVKSRCAALTLVMFVPPVASSGQSRQSWSTAGISTSSLEAHTAALGAVGGYGDDKKTEEEEKCKGKRKGEREDEDEEEKKKQKMAKEEEKPSKKDDKAQEGLEKVKADENKQEAVAAAEPKAVEADVAANEPKAVETEAAANEPQAVETEAAAPAAGGAAGAVAPTTESVAEKKQSEQKEHEEKMNQDESSTNVAQVETEAAEAAVGDAAKGCDKAKPASPPPAADTTKVVAGLMGSLPAAASPPSAADTTKWVAGLMGSLSKSPSLAIKKYIAKINESISTNGISPDKTNKKDITGPPSRLYRGLKHITEFYEVSRELEACESKEDVQVVKKKWKPAKAALTELLGVVKNANKRLDKAIIDAKALQQGSGTVSSASVVSAARASVGNKRSKASASAAVLLWEVCADHCRPVDVIPLPIQSLEEISWDAPLIFHRDPEEMAKSFDNLLLTSERAYNRFANHAEFHSTKRQHKKLIDDSLKQATAMFDGIFLKQVPPPADLQV